VIHRSDLTRRDALRTLALGLAAAGCRPLTGRAGSSGTIADGASGWDMVPGILARIKAPTFADRDVDVTRHGAVGDGRTDCTAAFRAAIDACHAAGGGRVVVPAGRFLTGPIHLRSNVNLHVTRQATIAFAQDPRAYLPAVFTRWEGVELMGYSPLVYAFEQENVADTTHWWPWKGNKEDGWRDGDPHQKPARDRLFAMAESGAPVAQRVFAEGSYLRPQFFQPYRCRNVLIEGVTIRNSPMWEIHPVLCTNVIVRKVRIETHGPNNDGCDPESCRDVLIEDCYFDTGDDCIAIKSGRNADGRRLNVPTENVVIRGCHMKDGHGGVTIGSEISGGVRNVFAERCTMDSPHLDRALRIKNNAARGGVLEHIYMRDVTVGEVADSVLSVDFHYEEGKEGRFVPVVRDVEMRNVTSRKSRYGLYMRAYERSEISNVRVVDCRFDGVARGNVAEQVRDVRLDGFVVNGQPVTSIAAAGAAKP
jgi:polygalacturonase